jgi:hypothetical protein
MLQREPPEGHRAVTLKSDTPPLILELSIGWPPSQNPGSVYGCRHNSLQVAPSLLVLIFSSSLNGLLNNEDGDPVMLTKVQYNDDDDVFWRKLI